MYICLNLSTEIVEFPVHHIKIKRDFLSARKTEISIQRLIIEKMWKKKYNQIKHTIEEVPYEFYGAQRLHKASWHFTIVFNLFLILNSGDFFLDF